MEVDEDVKLLITRYCLDQ